MKTSYFKSLTLFSVFLSLLLAPLRRTAQAAKLPPAPLFRQKLVTRNVPLFIQCSKNNPVCRGPDSGDRCVNKISLIESPQKGPTDCTSTSKSHCYCYGPAVSCDELTCDQDETECVWMIWEGLPKSSSYSGSYCLPCGSDCNRETSPVLIDSASNARVTLKSAFSDGLGLRLGLQFGTTVVRLGANCDPNPPLCRNTPPTSPISPFPSNFGTTLPRFSASISPSSTSDPELVRPSPSLSLLPRSSIQASVQTVSPSPTPSKSQSQPSSSSFSSLSSSVGFDELSPEPEPSMVADIAPCIAIDALYQYPAHQLVFKEHVRAAVLCDANDNCATPGHVVVHYGKPMMMRSYCDAHATGGCRRTVKLVNSPRMAYRRRIKSNSQHFQYTTLSAKYESRVEEHVMRLLVHLWA